jgi:hypothetical protein
MLAVMRPIAFAISGNTTAGGTGSGLTGALRKQGTIATTNDFAIEGMAATSTPGENYVGGLNPGSAEGVGDGSVNGVLLISARAARERGQVLHSRAASPHEREPSALSRLARGSRSRASCERG